jgi:micrococcal nuclease
MRILLSMGLLVLLLNACGSAQPSGDGGTETGSTSARVVRAIDGDTIEVELGGAQEDVRYIGIDTPETVDPDEPVGCFGHAASRFNSRLVSGRRVRLVFDRERRDQYGRLLAYVHLGERFVNAALVRGGYARTLVFPPNTRHAAQFARLQQRAADRGRGLWGRC